MSGVCNKAAEVGVLIAARKPRLSSKRTVRPRFRSSELAETSSVGKHAADLRETFMVSCGAYRDGARSVGPYCCHVSDGSDLPLAGTVFRRGDGGGLVRRSCARHFVKRKELFRSPACLNVRRRKRTLRGVSDEQSGSHCGRTTIARGAVFEPDAALGVPSSLVAARSVVLDSVSELLPRSSRGGREAAGVRDGESPLRTTPAGAPGGAPASHQAGTDSRSHPARPRAAPSGGNRAGGDRARSGLWC